MILRNDSDAFLMTACFMNVDREGPPINISPITTKEFSATTIACYGCNDHCEGVRASMAPRMEKQQIRAITKKQANTLLKAAREAGEIDYMAILLALSTGMRRGEIFALHWEDVDIKKGELTVNQSVTTCVGKVVWGRLKPRAVFAEYLCRPM